MAEGLAEFHERLGAIVNRPGEFSPKPYYDSGADALFFYARDVPSYAKRVNSLLTLFLSIEDHSLVGCKVKSVQWILRRMEQLKDRFGIAVVDHKLRLGILVEFALVEPPDETPVELQRELLKLGDIEIDRNLLVAC